MLTEAQRIIIRDICSIQFKSLSDILIKPDLGDDEEGESYQSIMDELGFGRKDFDEELINTIGEFKRVQKDPELIYELDELDLVVFKHILHNFRHKWEDKYPNAMRNLWDKLFIWTMSNEIHNQN